MEVIAVSERNLVIEFPTEPEEYFGALLVHAPESWRGKVVSAVLVYRPNVVPRRAQIVPRMVNGEKGFSAWFPELLPGAIRVTMDDKQLKRSIEIDVFVGSVAEVDWREY